MEKRWNILAFDEAKATALQQQLKISKRLCGILVQRGIEDFESSRNYFRPRLSMLHSPWLMKDMDKAVTRLISAFDNKEKILVFGDYDVDGTTAVASMYSFLSGIYDPALLDFYIPHRYREGYGVSKAGIDHAAANGYGLIVCLDCGIKSVELIAYAASLGIDFIVCDHHLPGEELPPAAAILNPKQPGCEYPYKELCGCGVGFKLMTALTEALNTDEGNLYSYLDLVATAIAADIVPITGENRVLAYFGLKKINENPLPGIRSLVELSGAKPPLSITNVVFVIAPRVNAAGRMDDARKAVQLFIEKDPVKAFGLAEMLHNDNAERKEADRSITAEALELMIEDIDLNDKTSTVVYREHWHKGVVGIVASRLIETHHRPTVVLTYSNGLATGSARSVPGFNLYEAIYACREYLVAYGGHFAAAGLSMLPEHVEPFRQKFEMVVETTIDKQLLIPEIVIDAELDLTEIKEAFYSILTQMEPYGPQNMRPVFITKNVTDTGFSRILKEQHVRFSIWQKDVVLTGIGFNMADKFPLIESRRPFDIVYTIDENEWNGTKTLQLKVIDVKFSG
ncbi:single-stranded-DNA-specific exonuclease RecJ [Ferruginibacter sp. HRS2-29]|uniref:single-stranded-DNA-specific exonuclease RecJ n=1 Tax=Ferruginibacter sp. HRS2-29 TaxID=2487334 RepID=UPI0020CE3A60|nr:single-stranded-DNA-specific exonuclease RecJ [Ferruginibacter sp. HRS2-29]MCP9750859.1 single-stranded-DNA-specific exonuclease RecJ [Ferruginibacter sp. HRS2-29]